MVFFSQFFWSSVKRQERNYQRGNDEDVTQTHSKSANTSAAEEELNTNDIVIIVIRHGVGEWCGA